MPTAATKEGRGANGSERTWPESIGERKTHRPAAASVCGVMSVRGQSGKNVLRQPIASQIATVAATETMPSTPSPAAASTPCCVPQPCRFCRHFLIHAHRDRRLHLCCERHVLRAGRIGCRQSACCCTLRVARQGRRLQSPKCSQRRTKRDSYLPPTKSCHWKALRLYSALNE